MNRTAGVRGDYPFGDVEREKGMKTICRLTEYYLLELISACWMGNHFHIVLYAPGKDELPENSKIAHRHNTYYKNKKSKWIDADNDTLCRQTAEKMRDISDFMKILQQSYTNYMNKKLNRRGRFWADRFKSTIIEGRDSLMTVIKYVELNPVRAGLTDNPADYRHSTWGWFNGSGKHLFKTSFLKHLRMAFTNDNTDNWTNKELINEFRNEIARTIAYEKNDNSKEIKGTVTKARKRGTMPIQFLRRMRHISDGGIIGSKIFVIKTALYFRNQKDILKKKFSHGKTSSGVDLYCYKQLRKLS
jgi:REP element-mobilizing transposase RayT